MSAGNSTFSILNGNLKTTYLLGDTSDVNGKKTQQKLQLFTVRYYDLELLLKVIGCTCLIYRHSQNLVCLDFPT